MQYIILTFVITRENAYGRLAFSIRKTSRSVHNIASKYEQLLSPLLFLMLLGKEQDTKPYEDEFVSLSHHEIEILSKWYFVAILCLAQFKDNHATQEWVTSKINILKTEAKEALELLVKLNFIKIENEKMIETKNPFQHKSTVPSEQIRNYHKMNLNLAEYAIDNFHMNERILGSISVPTNKKQLVKVLPIVEKFKIDMANALGVKEPQDVYTVAVQVFPITK